METNEINVLRECLVRAGYTDIFIYRLGDDYLISYRSKTGELFNTGFSIYEFNFPR